MGFFNRRPLDFDSRLNQIIDPPNGIFCSRRAPIDKGQAVVDLVAQDPISAAQSEAALNFLSRLAHNKEGHHTATAVKIMLEKAPNEFTKSKDFGNVLGALASGVFAEVALETFESAVTHHGLNVAANPSTYVPVDELWRAGFKGAIPKAISVLASDSRNAAALSNNPGLANIISTLTQTAMGDAGMGVFEAAIGLFEAVESADPVALSRNESGPQALDALVGLRDSRRLAEQGGLTPELTQRINDIVGRAQQPLETSRGF